MRCGHTIVPYIVTSIYNELCLTLRNYISSSQSSGTSSAATAATGGVLERNKEAVFEPGNRCAREGPTGVGAFDVGGVTAGTEAHPLLIPPDEDGPCTAGLASGARRSASFPRLGVEPVVAKTLESKGVGIRVSILR